MVSELAIKYSENLRENKIAGEIYDLLRDNGIEPLEVISSYLPKMGIFNVKYCFSKINNLKLSLLEGILNNANLLERVEIINNS